MMLEKQQAGMRAASAGVPISRCPYVAGSESAKAWRKGWRARNKLRQLAKAAQQQRTADGLRSALVRCIVRKGDNMVHCVHGDVIVTKIRKCDGAITVRTADGFEGTCSIGALRQPLPIGSL